MLAKCIGKYADHYNILSSSQKGFRTNKNPMRQLKNMMNFMSHANMSHQDLYIMYVDFSVASSIIDHDKLH